MTNNCPDAAVSCRIGPYDSLRRSILTQLYFLHVTKPSKTVPIDPIKFPILPNTIRQIKQHFRSGRNIPQAIVPNCFTKPSQVYVSS